MSETTLCDQCGRIAYVDEQRHCALCGDIICARRCCTRNHLRPVTMLTREGVKQVPRCTTGPGARSLRHLAEMVEAPQG